MSPAVLLNSMSYIDCNIQGCWGTLVSVPSEVTPPKKEGDSQCMITGNVPRVGPVGTSLSLSR